MAAIIRRFNLTSEYGLNKLEEQKKPGFACVRSNKSKTGRIMSAMTFRQD